MLALLLLVAPVPEAPKPEAPVVTYRGKAEDGTLTFTVTNPNGVPVTLTGYRHDSFAPPLPEGTFTPTYRIERKGENGWVAHEMGWCKQGQGPVHLKPKGTLEFVVHPPAQGEFRLGLPWRAGDHIGPVAWSAAVPNAAP